MYIRRATCEGFVAAASPVITLFNKHTLPWEIIKNKYLTFVLLASKLIYTNVVSGFLMPAHFSNRSNV